MSLLSTAGIITRLLCVMRIDLQERIPEKLLTAKHAKDSQRSQRNPIYPSPFSSSVLVSLGGLSDKLRALGG
jgi:hypothetical protein